MSDPNTLPYPQFSFLDNGPEQILYTSNRRSNPKAKRGEIRSFGAYLRENGIGRIQINPPSDDSECPSRYDGLHYDEPASAHFNENWRKKLASLYGALENGQTLYLENWTPGNGSPQDPLVFKVYLLDDKGNKQYLW